MLVPKPFQYFALILAAGQGTRLGHATPKQYLRLGDHTMLEHSIAAVLNESRVARAFVVVSATDDGWRSLHEDPRVEFLQVGGTTRAESVLNALSELAHFSGDDDRVLVHDAARPCLGREELARLIDEVGDDPRGGLLAVPLTDTLKRAENGRATGTLARDGLWCAQTPQMFRVGTLRKALQAAHLADVTDDSSAIEAGGDAPMLVLGAVTNIKVTTLQDVTLASAILGQRT